MDNLPIHPVLAEIAGLFAAAGREVYLVGGAVRDLLRGKRPKDWDLTTPALPQEVAGIFKSATPKGRIIPTGIRHGTVTVHFRGESMEITTFRTESGYSDGRRPDEVRFGASLEEDLSRRDFTMNAAAYRLPGGPLRDPWGGAADIEKRLIRCVGNPEERFGEDGLRPLRAVRFASQLGFTVDGAALDAIPGALALTAAVAPERIKDELDRIIASPRPSAAFLLMEKTGLLELLLPELARCRGVEQKGAHQFDVLDHSLLACDFAARESYSPEIRLAALLHDTGKPLTLRQDAEGVRTFYLHEQESARIAAEILLRFRYPRAVVERVRHLVGEHMFHYEENWKDAAVRRFIIRVGEEYLGPLYQLRRADAYAAAGLVPPPDFLLPLQHRVEKVLSESRALSLKDLGVTGRDLMALGIPQGKHLGLILRELLEAVVEDPELNTPDRLLDIAEKINRRYLKD
jgi:tRNA nucleotidyltransferase/poly(A) polymerase